jgi:hypothetical protein
MGMPFEGVDSLHIGNTAISIQRVCSPLQLSGSGQV